MKMWRTTFISILIGLLGTTYAHAFDFDFQSFGEKFDSEAQKMGSTLRFEQSSCTSIDGGSCVYKIAGLQVSLRGVGGSPKAARISVLSPRGADDGILRNAETIIASLCSPQADETKRTSYLFALQTALDNDQVANPEVHVVLDKVRYSLKIVNDKQGAIFQVEDDGAWHEEPRPVQPSAQAQAAPTPQPEPPAKQADAEPPVATTAEIVAPIAPGDYKVADPEDLHVAPRKFVGKPIEIRNAHCYYADVDDYRCLAPGYSSVAIFATSIEPPAEKAKIEADCGALKVATTTACQRNLHFVLEDWTEDRPNNTAMRIVLKPRSLIIVPLQSAKKRRG